MRKLLLLILILPSVAFSQSLDKIGKKEMFKVSGGMNYSGNFYDAHNKIALRDPYSWVLSGNVNFSLIDFSLPFTFTFTNIGGSYTQPFNITAVHPSYKNFKSHIGIISMSFSPYTLSGLNFAGAGAEYSLKNWKFKAFGGRLRKAVEYSPELNNLQTLAYKRIGGGISVGYENKGYGLTLDAIKAKDYENSIAVLPNVSPITPMENMAFSIKGKATLVKSLNLEAEYAMSLLTQNIALEDSTENINVNRNLAKLVNGNSTTEVYHAYNSTLNYVFKKVTLGVKYERIDPGYLTLGGLYFNNDLENITFTPSISLYKGRLNLNLNTGVQKNNLNNKSVNQTKRWVGSLAISSSPFKGFSVSANYSNFSSFSRRNPSGDPFYNQLGDTLNYYQISSNASLALVYTFGEKTKHSLMTNFTYSTSENITGRLENAGAFGFSVDGTSPSGNVDVITSMLGYTIGFANKTSLGLTANLTQTNAVGTESLYFGPGVSFSRSFKKPQISINSGVVYNQNKNNGVLANHIMNIRSGVNYAPQWFDKKYGKLTFGLTGSIVNRFPVLETENIVRETTIILNLAYGF